LVFSPTRLLAVDPGLSGAVCVIGRGVFDVRRDFKELPDIAKAVAGLCQSHHPERAVMEFVAARPGQGVCSMFSFGRAAGTADGALTVCLPAVEVQQVTPQVWQRYFRELYNIPRTEDFDSRLIAVRLFPRYAELFARKKDHNSADAVLIAAWALLNAPQGA
jgi:crossover junction endodeoxyribonuclease RuvC